MEKDGSVALAGSEITSTRKMRLSEVISHLKTKYGLESVLVTAYESELIFKNPFKNEP